MKQDSERSLGYSTLSELMCRRAHDLPENRYTFLLDGEQQTAHLSYRELDTQARAIATALRRLATPGERALLVYPPGLDYVAALFGCFHAGVIAVPAYPPDPTRLDRTLPRLLSIVRSCQPRLILTLSDALPFVAAMTAQAPELAAVETIATDHVR